jgi:hypothetical protein
MATSLIDSVIFHDTFGTEAMRRVWPDENRTQRYLGIARAGTSQPRCHLRFSKRSGFSHVFGYSGVMRLFMSGLN